MTSFPSPPAPFSHGLFLRRVNDAFRPVLGGEEIKAAAVVTSGPLPYRLIWLTTSGSLLASWLASNWLGHPDSFWLFELTIIVPAISALLLTVTMQKTMLIAIAGEQLLISRWSTRRHRGSPVVVMPASSVMMRVRQRRGTTTIVLDGTGTGQVRLHAIKGHRAELNEVLGAANMAGTLIAQAAIA